MNIMNLVDVVFLVCKAVWTCKEIPIFWRNTLPLSLGLKFSFSFTVSQVGATFSSQNIYTKIPFCEIPPYSELIIPPYHSTQHNLCSLSCAVNI